MINFIYRLFLTFNATSLILAVYFVKTQITLKKIVPFLEGKSPYISYSIYFLVPLLLTYVSLLAVRLLDDSSLEAKDGKQPIKEIEQANNAYLPSYLGYFFVALSVPLCSTLLFVFLILFLFTFLSQTLYFNPLFLVFGYKFYYLTTKNEVKVFVITKKILKKPDEINLVSLKRINDFTFIDIEPN